MTTTCGFHATQVNSRSSRPTPLQQDGFLPVGVDRHCLCFVRRLLSGDGNRVIGFEDFDFLKLLGESLIDLGGIGL